MKKSKDRSYRDKLNPGLEAVLSKMVLSTLSEEEKEALLALRERHGTDKLAPPPRTISKSKILIHFFWSELLKELETLEHSDSSRSTSRWNIKW